MSKKKITALTPEQIARLPDYARAWTEIGLSTEPADRPRAERAIGMMYRQAGMAAPRIVWCGSPLSIALTRTSVWDSVGTSVRDSVLDSVWDSVGTSVRDSVRAGVRAGVGTSVRDSVLDSVWDSVGTSVRDSVRASVLDSVRASVGTSVRDSVWDSVRAGVRAGVRASVVDSVRASVWDSVRGQHDAGWLVCYAAFRDLGLRAETAPLEGLWELAQSAGWALPHEHICWVSERHNILRRDDAGRLHCETGPAVAYPDGWEIYAWHGTRVPAEWINRREALTPEIALTWSNVEQRRAACEIIGWHTVLSQLSARSIDKHADPQIGELLEVDLPDGGPQRFLRVRCGTGREFALPVPREVKSAIEAQAWSWGLDMREFQKPEVRT